MALRKRPSRARASRDSLPIGDASLRPEDLTGPDSRLIDLARRMRLEEGALHDAMDRLAEAERQIASIAKPTRERQLNQLTSAQEQEAVAVDYLEAIFREIASTPAQTKIGLEIKIQVACIVYGECVGDHENSDDLVLLLLKSILSDLDKL